MACRRREYWRYSCTLDRRWKHRSATASHSGIAYELSEVTIGMVKDGTSNTLLFGEKYLNPDNYSNGRDQADNGEMVIALIDNTSATVKRYYREKDGWIRLQPANETMKPIVVSSGEVEVQGVVVGVIRKY